MISTPAKAELNLRLCTQYQVGTMGVMEFAAEDRPVCLSAPPIAVLIAATSSAGLLCTGWLWGLLLMATLPIESTHLLSTPVAAITTVGTGVLAGRVVAALTHRRTLASALALAIVAMVDVGVGPVAGPLIPFVSPTWLFRAMLGMFAGCAAVPRSGSALLSQAALRRSRSIVAASVVLVSLNGVGPASAWIASVRRKHPTATMQQTHGVDLVVDTHQWLANQAVEILRGDSKTAIVRFLDSPDPSAPVATSGTPGRHETYRWRLLRGAGDADGSLYPQIPDHFHNWWTHGGRRWIGGSSAASNAELAFANAEQAWKAGDRGTAMHWLGATVHLTTDACVPQHQFFMINVYHHQFEEWVRSHQRELAVDRGGIYRADFRQYSGHGGTDWSSSHPRGWVDECAHRAAGQLQAATHSNATVSQPSDAQWLTATHIGDTQRLAAGLVAFFFEQVQGP